MLMESWFALDGVYSQQLGIILTDTPKETALERDIETVSIPGRNGDLVIDGGRWKNAKRSYTCAMLPGSRASYRRECSTLLDFLCPSAAYRRLEDSFNPDLYRLGRVTGGFDVSSILELAGEFKVEFDCKPQRFLKSGEYPVAFSETGELRNPTSCRALPLIYIYGTGAGSVTVGPETINVTALENPPLIIDCEQMDAYSVTAAGATLNKNGTISAPTFPYLESGTNVVSWTGEITGVEITPRWWIL